MIALHIRFYSAKVVAWLVVLLPLSLNAQMGILADPCFSSIPDATEAITEFSDNVSATWAFKNTWNGHHWSRLSQQGNVSKQPSPLCPRQNVAFEFQPWMWNSSVTFALKEPLREGKTYNIALTYTTVYPDNYPFAKTDSGFAPDLYYRFPGTDKDPVLIKEVPFSDTTWTTHKISFTATKEMDGIEHLYISHAREGVPNNFFGMLLADVCALGRDTTLCEGQQLALDAGTANSYRWQDNSADRQFNVEKPGTYFVELNNIEGCTDTIHVFNGQLPHLSLGPDTMLCPGQSLELVPDVTGADLVRWQDGSEENTFTVTDSGRYTITAINGCGAQSSQVSIDYFHLPELPAQKCEQKDLLLDATTEGAIAYRWQDGSGGARMDVTYPGYYRVDIEFPCGTYATEVELEEVTCGCDIHVPTAFTPNGDGLNEMFQPQFHCPIRDYHFAVFNRSGELVFESDDPGSGWNGRGLDGQLQEGHYQWKISYAYMNYMDNQYEDGREMGQVLLMK